MPSSASSPWMRAVSAGWLTIQQLRGSPQVALTSDGDEPLDLGVQHPRIIAAPDRPVRGDRSRRDQVTGRCGASPVFMACTLCPTRTLSATARRSSARRVSTSTLRRPTVVGAEAALMTLRRSQCAWGAHGHAGDGEAGGYATPAPARGAPRCGANAGPRRPHHAMAAPSARSPAHITNSAAPPSEP